MAPRKSALAGELCVRERPAILPQPVTRTSRMPATAIVDKSVLRSESVLETFLGANPGNRIALTDFCCMESYKGIAENNLPRSIRILERCANQVIILRGTRDIARLSLLSPLETRAFIDPVQTREFADFCQHVRQALAGDRRLKQQLDAHARVANEYLANLQDEAAGIVPDVVAIGKALPRDTLRRLHRGEDPTIEDVKLFIPGMLALAQQFYLGHPDFGRVPDSSLVPQSFILRFAVAGYLLAIDWIRRGGIETAAPAKLGNDVVDMNYVAMATYFDDLLTEDVKLQSIYADARWYVCDVLTNQW